MKTLRLKSILFGLIAVFAIAAVMTSCEQESIENLTEEAITENVSSKAWTQTFERQLTHSRYDAEERMSDGDMNTTSTDIEFGKDHHVEQHVGLCFKYIDIPQGAQICDAYIEFVADGTTRDNFTVEITGHDIDDPIGFYGYDYEISNRPRTSAYRNWTFGSKTWRTNKIVRSPDISSIVQEIVDRGGWFSGSDMAFVFETKYGNGTRRVYSYDHQDGSKSAKLVITYGGC